MDDIDEMNNNNYDHIQEEVNKPMSMVRHVVATQSEWVTTGEAARLLQVGSINTVKRWAREGKLHYRRLGGAQGRIQIERLSVENLLHSADSEFLSIQRSERTSDELGTWGREMTPEEMDELEADRNGQLPWRKST
jgi:hypothetical protein